LGIITKPGLISDYARMRRSRGRSKDRRSVVSSRFRRLAACTIDTSAERPEEVDLPAWIAWTLLM
jgi:hypothetical protein